MPFVWARSVTSQIRRRFPQAGCGSVAGTIARFGTVKICFTEIERPEEEYFAANLSAHEVSFAVQLDEVPEDTEAISVFINSKIDPEFLVAHPKLRLVTTRSTAVDHINLAACRARNVCVCNVPNYGETTVAEHTFALLLALTRRLREVMQLPKDGRFSYEAARARDLAGKTLGIIGMGHVGLRVAHLARAFQLQVLAYDAHPWSGAAEAPVEFVTLDQLLERSDVISLHASLSEETYHILNAETLSQCKDGVLIINTARGALVDTTALREALESGKVGGAGLDVLQDERVFRQPASKIIAADIVKHLRSDALAHEARDADRLRELQELMLGDAMLGRSNVVFTPHVAFNSEEAVGKLRETTVANIRAFEAGKPEHVVQDTTTAASLTD